MKNKKNKKIKCPRLVIQVSQQSCLWLVLDSDQKQSRIKQAGATSWQLSPDQWVSEACQKLPQILNENQLTRYNTSILLPHSAYQLILVDIDDLPAEDLHDALKFKVKDLITFPLSDAVIDSYTLPDEAFRGRSKKAYAAVAKKDQLRQLSETLFAQGIKLRVIDCDDLVNQHLFQMLDPYKRCAYLEYQQDRVHFTAYYDGALCISRRFNISADSLNEPDHESSTGLSLTTDNLQIQIDSLGLELQRSFDYFESQMGLGNMDLLLIGNADLVDSSVTEYLKRRFSCMIQEFRVENHFEFHPDTVLQPQHLPLLAASLRDNT